MAFDFNGSSGYESKGSGSGYGNDSGYGSGSGYGNDSGYGNSSGYGNNSGYGNDSGYGNSSGHSSGSGFQDRPATSNAYSSFNDTGTSISATGYSSSARPRLRSGLNFPAIRWEIIIPVLLFTGVLVTLYVLRDAITAFLEQLLSWVLVLVIIVMILRGILFPDRGRRRW